MPEKSLIVEVADNIENLFKEMWPYQDQQTPMKVREHDALHAAAASLALSDADLALMSPEDRERTLSARSKENEAQTRLEKARLKVREISGKVSDELSKLTEDTYPRRNENTPAEMYDFLLRFSRSYTKEGKQRSAGPILEYLYSSCDHAYWLWREWIASCMAVGDLSSAERLLAVLTDGSASSTQAHRFNAEGGLHKPFVVISKGLIALKRDGDLQLAQKYAETARLSFAEAPEAINFYHAIGHVAQEVEDGNLDLKCLMTGRNGQKTKALLDSMIPPRALINGRWQAEEPAEETNHV